MIVLLTGAPGAGKGTQADLLQEKMGFRKVSTGDALRKHIKAGTAVGKVAAQIVAEGKLVPDDVLFNVLKEELGTDTKEKILLDGYPRNVNQAETLKKLEKQHPVKLAIQLEVDRDELINRLSGRRVCSKCGRSFHVSLNPPKKTGVCDACQGELTQRPDDKPEKVSVRLQVYEKETMPVLDFYKKSGLYREIDGSGDPKKVFKELSQVLGTMH
jgi:adenylate kinase